MLLGGVELLRRFYSVVYTAWFVQRSSNAVIIIVGGPARSSLTRFGGPTRLGPQEVGAFRIGRVALPLLYAARNV